MSEPEEGRLEEMSRSLAPLYERSDQAVPAEALERAQPIDYNGLERLAYAATATYRTSQPSQVLGNSSLYARHGSAPYLSPNKGGQPYVPNVAPYPAARQAAHVVERAKGYRLQ